MRIFYNERLEKSTYLQTSNKIENCNNQSTQTDEKAVIYNVYDKC